MSLTLVCPEVDRFAEAHKITVLHPDNMVDDSVDTLMNSHSLEHVEIERLADRMTRFSKILKTGGILGVEVPHAALSRLNKPGAHRPHTLFFSPEGLEKLFARFGFKILERGFADHNAKNANIIENGIYHPEESNEFFSSTNSSGIFMICTKAN